MPIISNQEDDKILTGFINETVQLLDSFWEVQTNSSGTYSLLEDVWELMEFQEENLMLTSRTEEFLTFCVNQTMEGITSQLVMDPQDNVSDSQSTWIQVHNLSECAAAFTDFKNHFRYIVHYPEVELPDELDNVHRAYGLDDDDDDDDDDNDCACSYDETILFPCQLTFDYQYKDEYSKYPQETGCFRAIDDTWMISECYLETLELSSNLIQATSFATALCYAKELRKVYELCHVSYAQDLDAALRDVCNFTQLTNEKATHSKDHVLKVEDSARRCEPLLIRWRDHVVDIGIHNSFPLQVIYGISTFFLSFCLRAMIQMFKNLQGVQNFRSFEKNVSNRVNNSTEIKNFLRKFNFELNR